MPHASEIWAAALDESLGTTLVKMAIACGSLRTQARNSSRPNPSRTDRVASGASGAAVSIRHPAAEEKRWHR